MGSLIFMGYNKLLVYECTIEDIHKHLTLTIYKISNKNDFLLLKSNKTLEYISNMLKEVYERGGG